MNERNKTFKIGYDGKGCRVLEMISVRFENIFLRVKHLDMLKGMFLDNIVGDCLENLLS